MANEGYDPEVENQSQTGSSSSSSSSTGGGWVSFTQGDALDPVRRKERAGNRKIAQGNTTDLGAGDSSDVTGSNTGGLAGTPSADQLKRSEKAGGMARDFGSASDSTGGRTGGYGRLSKKQIGIGAGVAASIAGGGFASFFLILAPLKIEHMVSNLEHRFFATSEQAVQQETDNMMVRFMKGPIADALNKGTCSHEGKVVVSKDCHFYLPGNGNNPVVNLYKSWRDTHIENTLADKGIELRFDQSAKGGGAYYLRAPGMTDQKVGNSSITSDFERVDRGTVRATFLAAESDATLWKRVMYRYHVGRMLEEKYSIKRCIVFCGTRDAFANSVTNKKYAAKVYVVERVVTPRWAAMGAVVDCLINQSCDTRTSNSTCGQSTCDELVNEPTTTAATQSEQEVAKVSAGFGASTADQLIQKIKDIRDGGGPRRYFLKTILEKFGAGQLTDFANKALGAIPILAKVMVSLSKLGTDAKMLNFVVNSTAAVSMYMMYRTYSDEIHTGSNPGKVDATEVGSFVSSLGAGDHCAPAIEGKCDTQLGGMASAEGTPLYNNLFDSGSAGPTTTATLLGKLLPSKAYAATATASGSSDYKCGPNADQPVPAGQLVCPEDVLGGGNQTATDISNVVNGPLGPITTAAQFLTGALGTLTGWLNNLMAGILSVTHIASAIAFITGPITDFFTNLIEGAVVKNPVSSDMGGGRSFVMAAAGSDVAGADYAHTGLGGGLTSATNAARVYNDQQNLEKEQFAQKPLFARMFSTDSDYSLITQLAMATPLSFQSSARASFASFVSNPFSSFTHGFAAIFSGKAAATNLTGIVNGKDVFGVNQYQPEVVSDPEGYWDANCTDDPSKAYQVSNSWNTEAANSNTGDANDLEGLPYNKTRNPCLTVRASVCAAGAKFDESNCSQDDMADVNGSQTSAISVAGTTAGPGSVVFPFPKQVGVVSSSSWSQDQGVDISTLGSACGKDAPEVAMSDGVIVQKGIGGFGPDAPILHVTDGPLVGRYIYYGHAGDRSNVNGAHLTYASVGQKVQAGQVITYTGCGSVGISSGPHLEIGISPKGASQGSAIPARGQTSGEMMTILLQAWHAQGGK